MNNMAALTQMAQRLQANPQMFFRAARLNVPNGMNDPNEIIQHLMRTGQVSQERYNMARQQAEPFRPK